KVLQIETALKAMRERGIEEQMVKLEREGLEPVLKSHGLNWAELDVAPCKLFYRRRVIDMPLADIPPNAEPKRQAAMRQARGEVYTYVDQTAGLLIDGPTSVFASGNVLTGKGNIKDSLESGTEVGLRVAEAYLGLSDEKVDLTAGARREGESTAANVAASLS